MKIIFDGIVARAKNEMSKKRGNLRNKISHRKNVCTTCAALMELALDACARMRDIADSSENVGVRTACEREWKSC
jgi:hypothetical protein